MANADKLTKAGEKRKRPARKSEGRPSKYTKEIGDKICSKISEGNSLNRTCKGDEFPSLQTVYSWFREHSEFLENYTRAKEDQAELYAEEIIDIADETMPKDSFGKIDTGAVNQARLRVDSRKWIASKLKPKKFGDKQQDDSKNMTIIINDKSKED